MPPALMQCFPMLDMSPDTSSREVLQDPDKAAHHLGPVFDPDLCAQPLDSHDQSFLDDNYTRPDSGQDYDVPSSAPPTPTNFNDPYLFPVMNKNERLRLTMLWYMMRDALQDTDLLARLQEKVNLIRDFVGWEYCIMGVLDNSKFTRVVTAGLPLVIIPRRESTCSHTINQPSGSIFWVSDMSKDWRFEGSPHVSKGGLKSYAGTALLCHTVDGTEVPLGSLCVASDSPNMELSLAQQTALKRVAHMLVKEVISDRRLARHRQRQTFSDSISKLEQLLDNFDFERRLLETVRSFYPNSSVSLKRASAGEIDLQDGSVMATLDAQNGLWENDQLFEELLRTQNHTNLQTDRTIRLIMSQVGTFAQAMFLVVETTEIPLIFDDVDSWYVERCARLLWDASQRRQLAEAMRAKETFLRGVTHQLRTPIHGILGAAELLAEELSLRRVSSTFDPSVAGIRPITPSSMVDGTSQEASEYLSAGIMKLSFEETSECSANNTRVLPKPPSVPDGDHSQGISKTDLDAAVNGTGQGQFVHGADLTLASKLLERQALDRTLQFLETINNSGRELMTTVNNILKLNRWTEISTALHGEPVLCDLHQLECDLVEEIDESLSPEELMNVSLVFNNKFDRDARIPMADASVLRDCVNALIVNAIQWSPRGIVSVTMEQKESALLIAVADDGRGIAPEHRDRIFQPYEKVDQHTRGAGLGLTLASKIAEALGGNLSLAWSEMGSGSKFVLEFPGVGLGCLEILKNHASAAERRPTTCRIVPEATVEPHALTARFVRHMEESGLVPHTLQHAQQDAAIDVDIVDFTLEQHVLQHRLVSADPNRLTICILPSKGLLKDLHHNGQEHHVRLFHGPLTTKRLDEITILLSDIYSKRILSRIKDRPKLNDFRLVSKLQTALVQPKTASPVALLVDDNPINLTILRMFCRKRGIPYYEAVDGEQATQIFQTECAPAINLVLMDLQMPVCDGLAATRKIREIETKEARIPSTIFMITGQDSPQDKDDSLNAGADEFMVKPVKMKALDEAIHSYFGSSTGSTPT